MHFAPPSDISISEDRIRREFDPVVIQDLKQSILSKGLLNPITCRVGDTGGLFLVAGETRLRALMELVKDGKDFYCNTELVPTGTIPLLLMDELSPGMALEAELEENTLRRQLTWQEEAMARKRLHDLRSSQAAQAGQTYNEIDTAKELIAKGVVTSPKPVVQDLLIGRFLSNPEVSGAKTKSEAFAKAKKIMERQLIEAIADQTVEHQNYRLGVGNSAELIKAEPAGIYDLILTDPPYGINVEQSGTQIANTHHYVDSPKVLHDILEWAPGEFFRVTREQAHLYWFCDVGWFSHIADKLSDAGWLVWRVPIIWDKKGIGVVPDPKMWPRRSYEAIIFAVKGKMPVLRTANDVINFAPVRTQGSAEKPKEVLLDLITRSVTPGARILDPFCGSGSIFLAARDYQCSATGFEINETIAKTAKTRTSNDDGIVL